MAPACERTRLHPGTTEAVFSDENRLCGGVKSLPQILFHLRRTKPFNEKQLPYAFFGTPCALSDSSAVNRNVRVYAV